MNEKHSETIPSLACAPGSHNPHGGPVSRRSGPRAWTLRVLLAFLLAAVAGLPVPLRPQETAAQVETTSKKQDKLLSEDSGFLGEDSSRLRPDPGNSDWLIYIKDPDALKKSDTFLLDPVKVYFPPDVKQQTLTPAELTRLTDDFGKAVRDELQAGHYTLASEPGPGVMELRLAIIHVVPTGGKTNMAVVGGAMAAVQVASLAAPMPVPGATSLLPRLKVGQVSIEGQLVDSSTGEVEMAFMTTKHGRRFFAGLKAYKKWGDVDAAFHSWAKNFRQRLDRAHAN